MSNTPLSEELKLRSGSVLKNRICKSAMNEAMATGDGRVVRQFEVLYRTWAEGGSGLLVTGNVMVDKRHANEPLAVAVEDERDMHLLELWARGAKSKGGQIWAQLNHPGKQSPKFLNGHPVAPSAVPLASDMFFPPRELTEEEILDIIERFANTASILEKAGFDGVQLHGAHGYLISQFLSPNHNKREDKWGGSLENRMRFVTEVYKAIRAKLGQNFAVGIKLNSSDFQKGGFTQEESIEVCKCLDELGIDMIEISGGSWENPVNRKGNLKESTKKREAYFLEFAEQLKENVSAPIMVTGGFRSQAAMEEAVNSGAVDVVGIARPLAVDPDLANKVLNGQGFVSTVQPITTGIKKIDQMAIMEISWYTDNIRRMGDGKSPKTKVRGIWSVIAVLFNFWKRGQTVKRVRA
ncbi:NADH:flavin oxidoreductase/NADH oxidase family protein [Thalassotalea euphylliae]|uniref:NADH oxidase n=1 Tax=Thalassotalea euphylliae TaxID=1655234 RepID=A0A3E0UB95_9GAMM|nr:NADH:flavin oxidoreductase/NADH oxidase family protein [Thalassotalea euphylliae]REL30818.1 NADH oxidase [Thalassotalea euphylliae]REL34271.1 NADH oxidase [Thalassotalea euphylliae]